MFPINSLLISTEKFYFSSKEFKVPFIKTHGEYSQSEFENFFPCSYLVKLTELKSNRKNNTNASLINSVLKLLK